jgi:protoporphyrinogen oxidase
MKEILIVGGGIAGLYAALRCCELGFRIQLFEKNYRLGGHIYTSTLNDVIIETGAGRFNSNHKLLFKLLNRYGLETYEHIGTKHYIPIINEPCKNKEMNVEEMIKRVLKYSEKVSEDLQKKITFSQLCEMVLGFEDTKTLIEAFGYNGEFLITNAYIGVKTFSEDFTNKYKYYSCVNGLTSLVDKIEDELITKYKAKIYKNTLIKSYKITNENKFILKTETDTYTGNYLIFALPKQALIEIDLFSPFAKALFDTVLPISLHRIYAHYPKPWFRNIPRITTDLQLRQFIPINDDKAVAMVSYSDLYDADYWKLYADQGEEELEKQLYRQLKRIFPRYQIPHSVKVLSFYWKNGTHTWIPGIDPIEVRKKIQELLPNVCIVGEAYSIRQGWIEGALETVEEVLPKIYKSFTGGVRLSYKSWIRMKNNILKEADLDEFKHLFPEIKWVILQLPRDDNKRIINVTEWMFMHPGGPNYFIDNMYKDITKLFKANALHYTDEKLKEHVFKMVQKYTMAYVNKK